MFPSSCSLVWFRRDLRDFDHAALHHALKNHDRVFCAFIFDTEILDALPTRADRRVEFILASVTELDAALRAKGGGLIVRHGRARELIPRLAAGLGAAAVYANRDYEPAARERDAEVKGRLAAQGIAFHDFKDQ
ncbi:MAG: deoxyribodipyrimidine photo-lyase, partial [Zoogloea sp.]|nr:deoxyribodipyrimidine photo-lyase [Zoogloea sp.]